MGTNIWIGQTLRLLVVSITVVIVSTAEESWATDSHRPGFCATYGICGHRSDGDVLSCATNKPAQQLDDGTRHKLEAVCPQLAAEIGPGGNVCCTGEQLDQIQNQIQVASIFLVGCPACNHNFKHFFCLLTCSPDQATFTNVTSVQVAADTQAPNSVKEIDVFVSNTFGEKFYNSCADVIYAPLNQRAMNFVGGGAKSYLEWLNFLGLVKDKRTPPAGSPFQLNFRSEEDEPEGMDAMDGTMASCGAAPLACSCGDCPSADYCEPVPPSPPPSSSGCSISYLHLPGPLICLDWVTIFLFMAILALFPSLVRYIAKQQEQELADEGGLSSHLASPLPIEEPRYVIQGDNEDMAGSSAVLPSQPSTEDYGSSRKQELQAPPVAEVMQYSSAEALLHSGFYRLGLFCAQRPWRTIGICVACVLLFSIGLTRVYVVTKPEDLWVGPESQAAAEKEAYENAFGPFYRISQLVVSTTPGENGSLPAITTEDNIRLLFDMQDEIDALSAGAENTTLTDVCLKPLGDFCATQSVLQYWGGNRDAFEGSEGPRLSPEFCYQHYSTACRAPTGAPVDPKVVLGGFPRNGSISYVADATAFVLTFPLSPTPEQYDAVRAWEAAFLELAATKLHSMASVAGLRISFSAQRSVEDELKRESNSDVITVLLSYLMMTAYVAIALGKYPRASLSSIQAFLVHGRVSLALGGVAMVGIAVAGALGICGWLGIGATLIIMEVIPFLALAVGVDNVFILTLTSDEDGILLMSPEERAAQALARAGPSMFFAASAEALGFAVGTLTSMPALRDFAACASFAIVLNFLLQITAFPAMLALDARRVAEGRLDCAPWIRMRSPWREEEEEDSDAMVHAPLLPEDATPSGAPVHNKIHQTLGVAPAVQWYMKHVHCRMLRRPWMKAAIITTFLGFFLLSCSMIPRLEKGLDQRIALPQDSYLQSYFTDVASLLRVGPPLSFVVRDLNISDTTDDVIQVCSVAGCREHSLLNRIARAARSPWDSYLAGPASSWLDDFLSWISPEIPQCCRLFANGTACHPPDQPPCTVIDPDDGSPVDTGVCDECTACFAPGSLGPGDRPSTTDFADFLPQFMAARPSTQCAKGGIGAYTDAVQKDSEDPTGIAGLSYGSISTSAFTAYYVPLSTQSDFINALSAARELAASAATDLNLNVFSYSIFHVFFEQYLTLGGEALAMLGSAAVAIFILSLVFTSNVWAGALVLGVLSMMCVDLASIMVFTGIQLNAVSLVNLAAAVGIGVEFVVHVLHAFMEAEGSKETRMASALGHVGAAVLTGITATKFIGVLVLAAAHTAIFKVYFFKFYLALVVVGAAHGFIFFPVVLSVIGPDQYPRWHVRRSSVQRER